MRVVLLRHGKAAPRDLLGADDPERPLVRKGLEQCRYVAELLRRTAAMPTLVLSSDYRRAWETAEQVLNALGLALPIHQDPRLRPEATSREIVERLEQALLSSAEERVLLVGHEPHLSSLAAALLGVPELVLTLKKGGLVEIDLRRTKPCAGRLLGLWRPPTQPT